MRGVFVTGTDTGVGKTVLAACLAAALRARGQRVAAVKPVVTGLDEPDPDAPADHVLLAAAVGSAPQAVSAHTFGPAVSPHLAAQLAGQSLDPAELVAHARATAQDAGVLVAEGVGGLLVPLATAPGGGSTEGDVARRTGAYLVRDYARDLGLPVVVAARPGLGTINHTLLTLEAARAAGLDVLAVVLTPWPQAPSQMERSNHATIAELGGVDVDVLPRVALEPAALAAAGAALAVCERIADAP